MHKTFRKKGPYTVHRNAMSSLNRNQIQSQRSKSHLVKFGDDWLGDVLNLLLGGLELVHVGLLVLFQPRDLFVDNLLDLFLLLVGDLGPQLLLVIDLILQVVGVAL